MKQVAVSVRISAKLHAAARRFAEAHDLTLYAALSGALERGIATMLTPDAAVSVKSNADLLDAVAELDLKIRLLDRRNERILHVASAGYAFGRFAALRGERESNRVNQALSDEADAVFRRQIELAKP